MDSDLKSPKNGLSPILPKPKVSLPPLTRRVQLPIAVESPAVESPALESPALESPAVELPPLRKLLASLPQTGPPQPPKTRWSSLPPLAPKQVNSPLAPKPVNLPAVVPAGVPAGESSPPLASARKSSSPLAAAIRPGILNKIIEENDKVFSVFYGDPDLIIKCIGEVDNIQHTERAYGKKTAMSGAFGKVYKININGVDYFVKKITYITRNRNTTLIDLEIVAAVDLTIRIPTFVSNIKAAYYESVRLIPERENKHRSSGYLIFEAQPGMNLDEFIKKNPPAASNKHIYDDLYIKIKRAQKALNAAGYTHQDIKPANIYVEINADGTPKNCKLIDFGLTRPTGSEFDGSGTPRYMSKATYLEHARTGKISPLQNDTSVKIIWDLDFKRENELPPIVRGGSRKNRNITKKRKNKSRKSRSS